jgi:hypothetical protein
MTELPKDCILPVGVEWCGVDRYGMPWFRFGKNKIAWPMIGERTYAAARDAVVEAAKAWFQNQNRSKSTKLLIELMGTVDTLERLEKEMP